MRLLRTILAGGLIAGALDITYAFVVYGPLSYQMSPVQILQSVAAGWVGHDAASARGLSTAVLGFATHFMMAIAMAAVFVLSSRRVQALNRSPLIWGFLYGLGLYAVMTYVVVPLSAAHPSQHFATDLREVLSRLQVSFSSLRPHDRWQLLGTLFTHTAFVGMPIALMSQRGRSRSPLT